MLRLEIVLWHSAKKHKQFNYSSKYVIRIDFFVVLKLYQKNRLQKYVLFAISLSFEWFFC